MKDQPVFEVNINDINYQIFTNGLITWNIPNNNRLPPVIGVIINRIPQLIAELSNPVVDDRNAPESEDNV